MKGRSRSAGPEVPSWAVPPARCSWADPAPGGSKPGAVRALPLSSLGQSLSLIPHVRSLLTPGSCFALSLPGQGPGNLSLPSESSPAGCEALSLLPQARWGSPRTHVLDRSARIERCVFPLWLLLLPETAAC